MTTATAAPPELAWVSATVAYQILGCGPKRLRSLIAAGLVRSSTLPGSHPRYALQDLLDVKAKAETSR